MRGLRTALHLCRTHPAVREVVPSGPCPGDRYSTRACSNRARFTFKGVTRCARHTASIFHDLPVRRTA